MPGFTKLFSSIVTSSIWVEDNATLRVWIAMMAQADADGNVEGTIPGFANLARVSIPEMESAVEILSSTDKHSRTPDFEGRRIERFDGGWKLLNYKAYRERGQAKEGSRAPYMRAYRKRESVTKVTRNNRNSEIVTRDTEAEAEERSRREKKEEDSLSKISTQTEDHSFLNSTERAPSALIRSQNEIFQHWNAQEELTTHRTISKKLRESLKARLTNGYSLDDLKQAVSRYAEFCREKCAPGHNHWGLFELVSRGEGAYIDRMLDTSFEGFKTEEQREDAKKRKLREEIRARDAKRAEEGEDDDENY